MGHFLKRLHIFDINCYFTLFPSLTLFCLLCWAHSTSALIVTWLDETVVCTMICVTFPENCFEIYKYFLMQKDLLLAVYQYDQGHFQWDYNLEFWMLCQWSDFTAPTPTITLLGAKEIWFGSPFFKKMFQLRT